MVSTGEEGVEKKGYHYTSAVAIWKCMESLWQQKNDTHFRLAESLTRVWSHVGNV